MPYLPMPAGHEIFHTESGAGRDVLLIHGWACDGSDWAWLVTDLAKDHRVVVIDNRGHGRSTDPGLYSPELFADDAAQVIAQLGLDRPIVVGHSMGTTIASALAVERPELVSALVLIDPVYGAEEAALAPALAAIAHVPHGFATAAFGQFYGANTPEWIPEWHRRRILGTPENVVRDALVSLYTGDGGIGAREVGEVYLAQRTAPMLAVFAGSGSGIATWERTLPHGAADQIEVWPENGHFLHQEDPPRFAATFREWIAKSRV